MNRLHPTSLMMIGLLISGFFIPSPALAQEAGSKLHLSPGFSLEYFSRTISWDPDPKTKEDQYTSRLKALTGIFELGYELRKGSTVSLLAGYSLSDFNGLVFRQVPFSIDYEAGNIGGFLLGAEVHQGLIASGYFEMEALAQFVFYFGTTKNFEVTTLNTDGTLDAKPDYWMRAQIGPAFSYRGFEYFSPFLSVTFNKLWGKFSMTETIGDLTGTEEKKLSAKSVVGVSLGTVFETSSNFSLRAEGTLFPFHKGTGQGWGFDFGGSLKAVISF
jgi:hypothetical protein